MAPKRRWTEQRRQPRNAPKGKSVFVPPPFGHPNAMAPITMGQIALTELSDPFHQAEYDHRGHMSRRRCLSCQGSQNRLGPPVVDQGRQLLVHLGWVKWGGGHDSASHIRTLLLQYNITTNASHRPTRPCQFAPRSRRNTHNFIQALDQALEVFHSLLPS